MAYRKPLDKQLVLSLYEYNQQMLNLLEQATKNKVTHKGYEIFLKDLKQKSQEQDKALKLLFYLNSQEKEEMTNEQE